LKKAEFRLESVRHQAAASLTNEKMLIGHLGQLKLLYAGVLFNTLLKKEKAE